MSFALTALSTFTAFTQSESIVTLAGNAYITAATQQTGETNQRARRNKTFIDDTILPSEITNQWARTVDGRWIPITKARFTCDATGQQNMRLDYTGGAEGEKLFLSMGGFFDNNTAFGTYFERTGNTSVAPDIDFTTLE